MNVDTYLEFLRFALTDNSAVPNSVANINWLGLLRFAKEQAVVGIYARRILFSNDKLNECNWLGNRPGEDDVMDWMAEAAKLRKRNLLLFSLFFILSLGRTGKLTGIIKQHGKCTGSSLLVGGDGYRAFGVANL